MSRVIAALRTLRLGLEATMVMAMGVGLIQSDPRVVGAALVFIGLVLLETREIFRDIRDDARKHADRAFSAGWR